MPRRVRSIAVAAGAVLGLFAACNGPVALAQEAGTPTKEDIIRALNTAPESTTRGFVQVPGAPHTPTTTPATSHVTAPATGTAASAVPASASAEHASVGVPILFDINSATIKPESRPTLESIGAALNSPTLKDANILIEGHTDGSGSSELNEALSKERAAAVKDYLVQIEGITAARLATVGKGSSDPVDPAKPLSPENRRVVLVNLNK